MKEKGLLQLQLIIGLIAVIGIGGAIWHHDRVKAERDRLRVEFTKIEETNKKNQQEIEECRSVNDANAADLAAANQRAEEAGIRLAEERAKHEAKIEKIAADVSRIRQTADPDQCFKLAGDKLPDDFVDWVFD